MSLSRRGLLSGAALLGGAAFGVARAQGVARHGVRGLAAGAKRALPARFGGFNTPVMWDIPYEDPRLRPIVAATRPALLRFPGGTIANYWNWHTGRVEPDPDMIGNFAIGARNVANLHPQGASMEDFEAFSRAVGAETVLVLNQETATIDDQVAWLKRLADQGLAPSRIEMGNEFYLEPLIAAAAGKPPKTPSQTRALEVSRQLAEAIAPYAKGATIAVQSAGSRYDDANPGPHNPFAAFDEQLVPADWFGAVTWHIYPEISQIMGQRIPLGGPVRQNAPERFRSAGFLTAPDAELALGAVLARVEQGTRRHAAFLRAKAPGKEVWVTEWGTGENVSYYRGERPVVTGLWIHVLARQLMALIAEPNVTMALNHSLYMDGLAWSCIRREDSEAQYRAVGAYDVFRWINEAANAPGGAQVTVLDVEGARQVPGGGPAHEAFTDVAALRFDAGGSSHLIIHNASADDVTVDLASLGGRPVKAAEAIVPGSLLAPFSFHTPPIAPVAVRGGAVVVPARSLARVIV